MLAAESRLRAVRDTYYANPEVPMGAIHRAYDQRMKCRDHTALFDPDFKQAVISLDREPLVFRPVGIGCGDEQTIEADSPPISAEHWSAGCGVGTGPC
jgi:hypothetical protein